MQLMIRQTINILQLYLTPDSSQLIFSITNSLTFAQKSDALSFETLFYYLVIKSHGIT
jgi:hypothetical protein